MKPWLPVLFLLLLASLFYLLSMRKFRQTGLPRGRVIYADNAEQQKLPDPLFDPALRLVGKPDYVVKTPEGYIVPVEFKSMPSPDQPYDSHILQLAAYCHLVGVNLGPQPAYGLIRYADKTFQIGYTPKLQAELQKTLSEIRDIQTANYAPGRSHQSYERCVACGFRNVCDQCL